MELKHKINDSKWLDPKKKILSIIIGIIVIAFSIYNIAFIFLSINSGIYIRSFALNVLCLLINIIVLFELFIKSPDAGKFGGTCALVMIFLNLFIHDYYVLIAEVILLILYCLYLFLYKKRNIGLALLFVLYSFIGSIVCYFAIGITWSVILNLDEDGTGIINCENIERDKVKVYYNDYGIGEFDYQEKTYYIAYEPKEGLPVAFIKRADERARDEDYIYLIGIKKWINTKNIILDEAKKDGFVCK